jgi:hypothetical protein
MDAPRLERWVVTAISVQLKTTAALPVSSTVGVLPSLLTSAKVSATEWTMVLAGASPNE